MYLLEELLLADSLEKIIRMEIYLDESLLHASEDEIKIIEFYKKTLKIIRNRLEEPTDLLREYHEKKFSKETSATFIKNFLNISIAIRYIHEDLFAYLPVIKTRAETYIFLKNLLQQTIEIKIEPAIILTDIYDYEERNISQDLRNKKIIKPGEIEEQIIIGLPKAEKNNTLMWAILVHEIGHDLAENYLNVSNRVIKEGITDKKIKFNQQTILINWVNEIISDILSLRMIGPSYLYSFILHSLLISEDVHNLTHPSPNCRMLIMMSVLKKRGFKLKQIKDLYNLICFRQRHSESLMLVDNTCPTCAKPIDPIPEMEEIEKEFNQLVNLSIKIINKINIKEYNPDNLKDCKKLTENLNNLIPISSSRDTNDKELKKKLKSFNNGRNDIYNLLEQFEESPNKISDIINAAWLHKVNNSYSKFIKIFFEDYGEGNNTFDKKYENYKKYLVDYDTLLLKSLEIADMNALLKFGRDLL